jgi:hypothetical protein
MDLALSHRKQVVPHTPSLFGFRNNPTVAQRNAGPKGTKRYWKNVKAGAMCQVPQEASAKEQSTLPRLRNLLAAAQEAEILE